MLKNFIFKIYFKICSFFTKNSLQSLSLEEFNAVFCLRHVRWKKTRDSYIKNNSVCAVCGSKKNLSVHHIIPVHIDKNQELNENNFIVLCQNKTLNCHFVFGHLMNWTKYNPNVIKDAKTWNEKFK